MKKMLALSKEYSRSWPLSGEKMYSYKLASWIMNNLDHDIWIISFQPYEPCLNTHPLQQHIYNLVAFPSTSSLYISCRCYSWRCGSFSSNPNSFFLCTYSNFMPCRNLCILGFQMIGPTKNDRCSCRVSRFKKLINKKELKEWLPARLKLFVPHMWRYIEQNEGVTEVLISW